MRVLRFKVDGLRLYENSSVRMDLYATDGVRNKAFTYGPVRKGSPIHTLTAIGVAGINASGKTMLLRVLDFVLHVTSGVSLGAVAHDCAPLIANMNDTVTLSVILEHEGRFYLLKSELAKDLNSTPNTLVFHREMLQTFTSAHMSKKTLAEVWNHADPTAWEVVATRGLNEPGQDGELTEDALRYLSADRSIIGALIGKNAPHIIAEITPLLTSIVLDPAPQVFGLFDESIETLKPDMGHIRLKFHDNATDYNLDPRSLVDVLSSGTLRGTYIVSRAIEVLKRGGYLLVDEIENSINKQLVFSIIDLFASPVTNPHGSTLVFTTHYPEILDRFTRKDNIWFSVRNDKDKFRLVHLTDKLNRNDVKKSVTFFANLVPGTAPSAESVRALRDYVKERLDA